MTGLRRVEAPTRANAQIVHLDVGRGIVKVNPLATWTDADIAAYKRDHELLEHPLVSQGYPSIGCWPCTRPVADGDDHYYRVGDEPPDREQQRVGGRAVEPVSVVDERGHRRVLRVRRQQAERGRTDGEAVPRRRRAQGEHWPNPRTRLRQLARQPNAGSSS